MTKHTLVWGALAALAAGCVGTPEPVETEQLASALVNDEFQVRGLAGKCMSVDRRSDRIVLAPCDASLAEQRVRFIELHERLVLLQILGRCIQPVGAWGSSGAELELADCDSKKRVQWWMTDGDSIRLGPYADWDPYPDLLVSVLDHSGADGSRLGIVPRRLDESDYWEFSGLGRERYPTSGFVPVDDEWSFTQAVRDATPGTVVDIDPDVAILLRCGVGVGVPRVTIRSGRHNYGRREKFHGAGAHLTFSPQGQDLLGNNCADDNTAIFLNAELARVTGIKLDLGATSLGQVFGIMLATHQGGTFHPQSCDVDKLHTFRIDVDHVDMENWKGAAVDVWGQEEPNLPEEQCRCGVQRVDRVSANVERNYLHHNDVKDGYGVVVTGDGHGTIHGNTFLHNRHAIAASGTAGVSYWATGNLVHYHGHDGNQDFDVHGSGDECSWGIHCGGRGGVAGEWIEVAHNTFFGADRNNVYIRGTPCLGARFADNVTRQQQEDGWTESEGSSQSLRLFDDFPVEESGNRFEISDPTRNLVVGDFNGDGTDDLFLATGAAHYVSFDGKTAWHFRGLAKELPKDLRFGDFDGDGRTDVLRNAPDGVGIQIRFGGEGAWHGLRPDVRLADLLAGKFDGDARTDLILTDGTTWRISSGGTAPWVFVRNSSRRASEFLVGKIDNNDRDDVFGVFPACNGSADCWAYFLDGTLGQITLGPVRAPLAELRIADVDVNGGGDIIRVRTLSSSTIIEVSSLGTQPLASWHQTASGKGAFVGRFDGGAAPSLVYWNSLTLRRKPWNAPDEYWAYFEMF